jgi:hypothetical protein
VSVAPDKQSSGGLASLQKLADRLDVRLALFALLALATCWPIFEQAANFNEFRDAQVLFSYERDAAMSVLQHGELPLWDPHYCGGLYALGTPQSRFASPFFLLSLVFGAQRAAPLIAFLLLMLGMEGTFRLVRPHSGGAIGPLLAAPLLALQGMFAVSYFNGWVNFFGFELLPWVMVGVASAGRGERRGVVVTALSFATIVGFGGTYAGPLAALLACVEGLAALAHATRKRGGLVTALKFLSLAATLSAGACLFRLWPVYEALTTSHRIMAGTPGHDWPSLEAALTVPAQALRGNVSADGAYFFPCLLLVFAPFALFRRRGALWLGLAALCLWTATGYGLGDSPFTWLRELPLFHMIRYPERFLFVFALYAAAASALGLEVVLGRLPGRVLSGAVVSVALLLAAWGVRAEVQNFHRVTEGMWLAPPPVAESRAFRQARGNRWALGYFGPQSRGSLSCWEAYPVPESPRLRADLPAEEYFADSRTGRVRRVEWSPNALVLDLNARAAGRVLINQNYHVGWHADVGEVVNEEGLLAVDVPAGHHRLTLHFLPRSAVGGGLAGLVALLVMLALWRPSEPRRLARGRYREALLVCAPLLVALLVRVALPEPAPSPAPVTNADGSPALLEELPDDATPVGARFAEPVELAAVALPSGVDDVGNARAQLFFRIHGEVSRDVGIFVHFDGRGRIAGDHQVVAASYYLADLPEGTLVRDAFSVNLREFGPGPVRVHMGLWRVSGDGTRVPVVDPGQVEVQGDSLDLGGFEIR